MEQEIDFRGVGGESVKRLVWSTDLHFDAADRSQVSLFIDLVLAYEPDAVLVGGDISNGIGSVDYLTNLSDRIEKPFYFVLGNHDFYYGSIRVNRQAAAQLHQSHPRLHYLTSGEIVRLTDQTALIGHDGWADGRAGDFLSSEVMLNDYFLIDELKKLSHEERLKKLNQLGDESARFFEIQLKKALASYSRIVLLTHVPPFEESCLYGGVPADSDWSPHFVCKANGLVIERIMKEHPEHSLLVLCGHSHWGQDINILPNVRAVTGHSELGLPNVQCVILVN